LIDNRETKCEHLPEVQYHVKTNASSGKSGSYDLDASRIIGFASSTTDTMGSNAMKLASLLAARQASSRPGTP